MIILLIYCDDVENYGRFRGLGFLFYYIYIDYL